LHRADAILVVDDNPDHADLLATLLRVKGFEVVAVYGPGQGLAALQARRFAVVLTDYHMPIKTGCAMLAEAKAAGLLEHTEVMAQLDRLLAGPHRHVATTKNLAACRGSPIYR
jgi:CheY-like chemotaxis protein